MMASVMCPACQHKQLLPEIEVGKLQSCPNCQSSFVAGTSTVQARGGPSRAPSPQLQPSYAKTMLAGAGAPPIKYNCPRCKAPLEAAAGEGGTKTACLHCTQRHQVPPAPSSVPVAPAPGLNKTMLAGDEMSAPPPPPPLPPIKYNCPNCKKPLEAPASEGGTKKNCLYCAQRLQVPAAASGLNKTKLASSDDNGQWSPTGATSATGVHAGPPPTPGERGQPAPKEGAGSIPFTPRNVGIGVAILLLLVLVVPALLRGGNRTDGEAAAKAQMDLEKLKAEIELKKQAMDQQKNAEAETRRRFDDMMNQRRAEDERMRAEHRALIQSIGDQNQKTKAEAEFNAAQRKSSEAEREREKKYQQELADLKRQGDENKRSLEAAQQRQQTIIHQPPPVVYYPPYHHRYYWPW